MSKARDRIRTEEDKLNSIVGAFLGLIIGDALGMPYEGKSPKEIMFSTMRQGVSGFVARQPYYNYETHRQIAGKPPASHTDDWQLNRAVTRSLVACGGFSLSHCVNCHVQELLKDAGNFGASTRSNLDYYRLRFEEREPFIFRAIEELSGVGLSNGVAVKVMPLALFYNRDPEKLYDIVVKLSAVTHRSREAMLSAHVMATLMILLYYYPIGVDSPINDHQRLDLLDYLIENLYIREGKDSEPSRLMRGLLIVRDLIDWGVLSGLSETLKEKSLSNEERALLIRQCMVDGGGDLSHHIGADCACYHSVPFVIAMFLLNPSQFKQGLIDVVNCGDDTDTNAAMLGALLGINLGAKKIPEELSGASLDFRDAGKLGVELFGLMKQLDIL